jgi:dolichyl-phosphate beta-glucosyltransferase
LGAQEWRQKIVRSSSGTDLSIVVPAYNEGWRLPETLATLFSFLASQSYRSEVIVVENGSSDNTSAVVERLTPRYESLRLLSIKEAGKGRAIRAGVLEAQGEAVFLCDADLSTPATEIRRFLTTLHSGYDIVVGSREGPGAIRYAEPEYRHVMGRVFNRTVQFLAVPDIQDTQCGFKAFSAPCARELFSRQTLTGWAFDVEILYLARKFGYRVAEIPVEWRFNSDTKVRALPDTWAMLRDIFKIRGNDLLGRYHVPRKREASS